MQRRSFFTLSCVMMHLHLDSYPASKSPVRRAPVRLNIMLRNVPQVANQVAFGKHWPSSLAPCDTGLKSAQK